MHVNLKGKRIQESAGLGWLIVIGAGKGSVPLLKAAHKMGRPTLVLDRDGRAPGAGLATRFVPIGRNDAPLALAFIDHFGAHHAIDGALSTSSAPEALLTLARVRAALALPGATRQATTTVLERAAWKKTLAVRGIETPASLETDQLADVHNFLETHPHAFMKPQEGGRGGAGVRRIQNVVEDFDKAQRASSSGRVLLEQEVEGTEFSIDFIANGEKAKLLQIARKYSDARSPQAIATGYAWGVRPGDQRADEATHWKALEEIANQLSSALDLEASLFTADVFVSRKHPAPVVIDVGFLLDAKVDRCLSYAGLDIDTLAIELATGSSLSQDWDPAASSKAYATRFWYAPVSGQFNPTAGQPICLLRNTEKRPLIEWEVGDGCTVGPPQSVADLLGWVHVEAEHQEAAWQKANAIRPDMFFSLEAQLSPNPPPLSP